VSGLGDSQARLSIKQDNLDTSMTNYEAARSRIEDTDFAKEQMEIVKLQILQQTGIGSLAQANSGPQSVLS
ncbi:flagellin, partial [Rubrivirga litoralis]